MKTAFNKFAIGEKSVPWHKNKLQRAFLCYLWISSFLNFWGFKNYMIQICFLKLLRQWKGTCWFKTSFFERISFLLISLKLLCMADKLHNKAWMCAGVAKHFRVNFQGPHLIPCFNTWTQFKAIFSFEHFHNVMEGQHTVPVDCR